MLLAPGKAIYRFITFPFCLVGLHECQPDYVIHDGCWAYASGDYETAYGFCHHCSRYLVTDYVYTGGLDGHWGRWRSMDQEQARSIAASSRRVPG